jgi:hypothetical protein
MGNKQTSVKKANFEDVQQIVKNNGKILFKSMTR